MVSTSEHSWGVSPPCLHLHCLATEIATELPPSRADSVDTGRTAPPLNRTAAVPADPREGSERALKVETRVRIPLGLRIEPARRCVLWGHVFGRGQSRLLVTVRPLTRRVAIGVPPPSGMVLRFWMFRRGGGWHWPAFVGEGVRRSRAPRVPLRRREQFEATLSHRRESISDCGFPCPRGVLVPDSCDRTVVSSCRHDLGRRGASCRYER